MAKHVLDFALQLRREDIPSDQARIAETAQWQVKSWKTTYTAHGEDCPIVEWNAFRYSHILNGINSVLLTNGKADKPNRVRYNSPQGEYHVPT